MKLNTNVDLFVIREVGLRTKKLKLESYLQENKKKKILKLD